MQRLARISGLIVTIILLMQTNLPAQTIDEGVSLVQQKKYAEAKTVFEQILDKNKNDAEAHYRLGLVFLNRGFKDRDVNEAVDQLEKAVDLNPNNADYQFRYGAALAEKAQNAGVIKQAFLASKIKNAFKRSVELNPQNARSRIALAQFASGILRIESTDRLNAFFIFDARNACLITPAFWAFLQEQLHI